MGAVMNLTDAALRELAEKWTPGPPELRNALYQQFIALRDAARADADAVLDMIRQALRTGGCLHGHDDHPQTPPMLYPEWIACAVAQACAEQREALESAGVLFAEIAECSNTTVEHLKALARNGIANVAAAIRSQR